jgi:hypothetical protein
MSDPAGSTGSQDLEWIEAALRALEASKLAQAVKYCAES